MNNDRRAVGQEGEQDARMIVQLSEVGPGIIWCNEAECQGGGRDPTWDKMTRPEHDKLLNLKSPTPPHAALLTLVIATFRGL